MFSRDQLIGAAGSGVLLALGFLLRFAWERWWRRKDEGEKAKADVSQGHGNRLIVLEKRVDAVELREEERQRGLGRLEAAQSIIEGKVIGLQDFWRSEFSNLRKELLDAQQKLRDELRQDQANSESRLTTLLTSHQERVHDRLNVIAADQAKLLTEFVDTIVERRST